MPFVPDAQQPGTPKFVPDTPATTAPAAQGAVAAFVDQLGKAMALPGKPEVNLAALADHITSFIDSSQPNGPAQAAATAAAHPVAAALGAGTGHVGEGALAASVGAPLIGAGAQAVLGAGRLASIAAGTGEGALGGAASDPNAPGHGAVEGGMTGGALNASAPLIKTGTTAAEAALGLRRVSPVGKTLAGDSTGPVLRASNAAASDAAVGSQAGLPKGTTPSYPALTAARAAPAKVMSDAADSATPGQLNAAAQAKLQNVGVPAGGTRGPDINTQAQIYAEIQNVLNATTGPEHLANIRSLRQEGFEGVAADTAAERNLGRAKLDMADAVEGHLMDSLPADGPVSPQQFLDARKALAKNYTATEALKGNSFDLGRLARIQRSSPNLLDGDMETVANFANNNPEITGHPSQLSSPNLLGDLKNISLAHPATYVQPFTGGAGRLLLKHPSGSLPVAGVGGAAAGSLGAQFEPGP